jgi:hypothetical protein
MQLTNKRVYLSGPVTSAENLAQARKAFELAEQLIATHDPRFIYNPMRNISPYATHEQAMLICLNELTYHVGVSENHGPVVSESWRRPAFDVLVSLPGWCHSEGATIERIVAEACGIECVNLSDIKFVKEL